MCGTNQVVHGVYEVPLPRGKLEDNNCKKSRGAWWDKFNVGTLLSFTSITVAIANFQFVHAAIILQQTETNHISYINRPLGTCFLHHPMSSHHDFASQEPENLGRSAREVQPTTRIGAYRMFYEHFLVALLIINNPIDAELAKKAASRTRRQERQTSCNQSLNQPAAMALPDGHFSRPATPMSATTPHHQAFNFPMPGHVQPGYLAMAQPQVPIDVVPQVGTTTGSVGTTTGSVQDCSSSFGSFLFLLLMVSHDYRF